MAKAADRRVLVSVEDSKGQNMCKTFHMTSLRLGLRKIGAWLLERTIKRRSCCSFVHRVDRGISTICMSRFFWTGERSSRLVILKDIIVGMK